MPKKKDQAEAQAEAQPSGETEQVAHEESAESAQPAPEPTEAARVAVADAEKKIEAKKGFVTFVSVQRENITFGVQIRGQMIEPHRDGTGEKLVFRVPEDLADGFRIHHHVVVGRLVEVK